eukprot:665330-Pyramimonas_sp.AAC.1
MPIGLDHDAAVPHLSREQVQSCPRFTASATADASETQRPLWCNGLGNHAGSRDGTVDGPS